MFQNRNDISIVLSGEAGQGLQTLEQLMLRVFKKAGYYVFSYSEFMSRIRGGNNSTQIRVSSHRVRSYTDRIDIFVPMNEEATIRFHERITPETVIIAEPAMVDPQYLEGNFTVLDVAFGDLGREAGGKIYLNSVMLGLFAGIFGVDIHLVENVLRDEFHTKEESVVANNFRAADLGQTLGWQLLENNLEHFAIEKTDDVKEELLMNGVDAVGLGGLAGGCNFVSSYPMSPSTGVLVFFARHAKDFGVVVEQAEDEICAINMCLGSWYAGGKAMVTTSGGGFALMSEGLSLAGCTETPIVIHIGQRPGPATGLPTRTEQADLEIALYAGHGEFPRIILAPGSITDAFILTKRAFDLADTYQVPVIILSDQYFLETNMVLPALEIRELDEKHRIVKTKDDYQRYAITRNGVSPRGIPGYGTGIVCVDSDEHDEGGYITEDPAMRNAMVEKRLRKRKGILKDALPPKLIGAQEYECILVGWGSTFNVISEAVEQIGREDIALLHFSQVYPLHGDTAGLINKAEKKIIIENNATGQLAKLIKLETGIDFDHKILKYSGMQFSLEEVVERVRELV